MRYLATCPVILAFLVCPQLARAQSSTLRWQQSESTVALLQGNDVLWQFNYGPDLNVPYFHPVSTSGGRVLTWDQPPDHVWHHALLFSWKYINKVNYWEYDRQTGKPDGRTEWSDVRLETRDDHSARISLTLAYHPAGDDQVVLSEQRRVEVRGVVLFICGLPV